MSKLTFAATRGGLALAAVLAGAVALPATAQTALQVPAVSIGANGVMTFPNVRVVQAPAQAAPAAVQSAGLMAFLDPDTKQLVEGLPGEIGHLGAAAAAQRAAPPEAGKPGGKAVRTFRTAGGGYGVALDESSMSYSVVRKTAEGVLVESCVVGEEAANRVVAFGGPVALPLKRGVQ